MYSVAGTLGESTVSVKVIWVIDEVQLPLDMTENGYASTCGQEKSSDGPFTGGKMDAKRAGATLENPKI